jgi:phosphoglucosamine mutase
LGFSLSGLKIVLDCANGATYHVAPEVLRELGAVVIEVASAPDGLNINEACGATAPQRLQKVVVAEKADLGIALDGDGDRLIMVDHQGEVIDGDEVLFIIVQRMYGRDALSGGVVGTLMTNFGFEKAMNEMGVPFIRADVGDRYVMAALAEQDWILGGESSGHIVCRHLTSTGDGIISALQVLRAMRETGKSLHELKCGMSKLPQVMINVKMPKRVDLRSVGAVQEAVKKTESQLGDSGRVLLRASGTEPLVRVMIEGEDKLFIEKLCQALAEEVRNALEALVTQD